MPSAVSFFSPRNHQAHLFSPLNFARFFFPCSFSAIFPNRPAWFPSLQIRLVPFLYSDEKARIRSISLLFIAPLRSRSLMHTITEAPDCWGLFCRVGGERFVSLNLGNRFPCTNINPTPVYPFWNPSRENNTCRANLPLLRSFHVDASFWVYRSMIISLVSFFYPHFPLLLSSFHTRSSLVSVGFQ